MESRILIRQALVLVDAARAPLSQSDILIEQDQIVAIAPHLGMRIILYSAKNWTFLKD